MNEPGFMYIFENKRMPWGDYGDILLAGMASNAGRKDGILQLERTGPFIPPITKSGIGAFVVTDACKRQLEQSHLTGFSFKPVHKQKIVALPWESWDLRKKDPQEYPLDGEPENYILEKPHDETLAHEMGDVWELCPVSCGNIEHIQKGEKSWEIDVIFCLKSDDEYDIFSDEHLTYMFLNKKAMQFIESIAGSWVQPRLLQKVGQSRYLIRRWDETTKWFEQMRKLYNPVDKHKKISFVQNEIPIENIKKALQRK